MDIGRKFRAGTFIAVVDDDLGLSDFGWKEKCKLTDVLAIRCIDPNFWHHGHIDIITKRTMARTKQGKKPSPYSFSFEAHKVPEVMPFFWAVLNEIQRYKGSKGTVVDGWWTWPEEQASEKVNGQSAAEPAEKAAVPPEAAPADAPAPAAPADAAAALSEADVEHAIQSRVTEEKQKKGPACPECGCTSIFAKDVDGEVMITCLNCGCQWRPGEHRSW